MNATLTFLGTGTSMGVPTLACACAVCTSTDAHDRRLRPSVLLRWREPETGRSERVVVIDTGPDFREQALREKLTHVDAVFYTHAHADHILGMDDLRPLSFIAAAAGRADSALCRCGDDGGSGARLFVHIFAASHVSHAGARGTEAAGGTQRGHGVEFVRIPLLHGEMPINGFRFGNAAYMTDVSAIPESSFALLEGVEVLVLSALRHQPHPSHATLEQALAWARRIGAKQTWFTHIAHELGHEETNRNLPENAKLAYDGLSVPVRL